MNGLTPDFQHEKPECTETPGSPVLLAGIYEACHADGRRETAVFRRGDLLPPCANGCCGPDGRDLRYRLSRSAPYLFEDEDFQRPQ